ncbi:MAG: ABC transporter substrate-binding protein [Anaerovoracaceae bacterium]
MKKSMRRNILLITLVFTLIFSMSLAGCNNGKIPENTDPVSGGKLILQLDEFYYDPLSLKGYELPIYDLNPILYRGLLKYDENLKIVNDLAGELTANLEKNQLKLKLKEGVKWEDDSPITYADVQYSFEQYSKTSYNGVWKNYTFNLTGTDKFRTKAAEHISGITFDEETGVITFNFDQLTINDLEFLTAPLISHKSGTASTQLANGPYRIAELTENGIELVRNENFGKDVFLDSISITTTAGKVDADVFYGTPADIVSEELKGRTAFAVDGSSYFYLGFNLNSVKLQDKGIREAIASAVNLDELLKNQLSGYAERPTSPIYKESWLYQTSYKLLTAKEAKSKLSGVELSLELAYPDLPIYKLIADKIATDLTANGVTIVPTAVPYETYIQELYSKGEYELFIAVQSYELNPAKENYKWLAKNDVLNNGYNAIHLKDAKSDQLLNEAYLIINSEQRKAKYQEWQEYFGQNFYIAPLVTLDTLLISKTEYQIKINSSLTPYYQIENWWYKAKTGNSKKK